MSSPPQPPGPRGMMGLGRLSLAAIDSLHDSAALAQQFGDVVRYRLAGERCFQFTHPDACHDLLVVQASRFRPPRRWPSALVPGLDDALTLACVRQFDMRLPDLRPEERHVYGASIIRRMRDRMRHCRVPVVNMREVLAEVAMSSVAELLLGSEIKSHVATLGDAARLLYDASPSQSSTSRWRRMWGRLLMRSPEGTALNRMRPAIRALIQQRRLERVHRDDWLARLLKECLHRPDHATQCEGVVNHALAVLLAIHHAMATALTWAVYYLARHPHHQQQIAREVVLAPEDRGWTVDCGARLAVTERILRETLRLHPAARMVVREAMETVEIGGFVVPRNTWCLVPLHMMHRDPRWFESPHEFHPARFAVEWPLETTRRAFLPFGREPQACLVSQCVMLGGILVLATMLERYSFRLVEGFPELSPAMRSIWAPHSGPYVQLFARRRSRHWGSD